MGNVYSIAHRRTVSAGPALESDGDATCARVLAWLYGLGAVPEARAPLARLHDRAMLEDVAVLLLAVPEVRRASAPRARNVGPWAPPARRFVLDELVIDGATREATLAGAPLPLEPIERTLLEYLAVQRGRVVSRVELLRYVWGGGRFRSRVADAYVGRLRKKLACASIRISTVRGEGYVLEVRSERARGSSSERFTEVTDRDIQYTGRASVDWYHARTAAKGERQEETS